MDKITCAFSAGLFDGEGTVGIRKRTGKRRASYFIAVQFHMTNKAVLDFIRTKFGGSAVHTCKRYPNRRQGYKWDASGRDATRFLRYIQPYCIVKRDEVTLALEFQTINVRHQKETGSGFRRRTPNEIALQEHYFIQLRELKIPK